MIGALLCHAKSSVRSSPTRGAAGWIPNLEPSDWVGILLDNADLGLICLHRPKANDSNLLWRTVRVEIIGEIIYRLLCLLRTLRSPTGKYTTRTIVYNSELLFPVKLAAIPIAFGHQSPWGNLIV